MAYNTSGVPADQRQTDMPGHLDDSGSPLLDAGLAFSGDLAPVGLAQVAHAAVVEASRRLRRERCASRVYSGHGPVRPVYAEMKEWRIP